MGGTDGRQGPGTLAGELDLEIKDDDSILIGIKEQLMSHTTHEGQTIFIHNGDYSGYIEIVGPAEEPGYSGEKDPTIGQVYIPFEDLADFIDDVRHNEEVSALEEAYEQKKARRRARAEKGNNI
jgi:hypothetical protein